MYKKLLIGAISFSLLVSLLLNSGISSSEEVSTENIDINRISIVENCSSISNLKSKRDDLLEKNLNLYDLDTEIKEKIIDYTFNNDRGLVKYIDNRFPNMSEEEKLEKQNKVLIYLNKNKTTLDNEPLFIECVLNETELSEFLVNERNDGNLTKKENLIVLAKNKARILENTNFNDENELTSYITALIKADLSKK